MGNILGILSSGLRRTYLSAAASGVPGACFPCCAEAEFHLRWNVADSAVYHAVFVSFSVVILTALFDNCRTVHS